MFTLSSFQAAHNSKGSEWSRICWLYSCQERSTIDSGRVCFQNLSLKEGNDLSLLHFFLNCVLSIVVLFSQKPNNLAFPVALYQNIIIISCPLLLFPFAILFLVPHWSRMKLNSPPNLWKCVKVNISILIFPHCSSF